MVFLFSSLRVYNVNIDKNIEFDKKLMIVVIKSAKFFARKLIL